MKRDRLYFWVTKKVIPNPNQDLLPKETNKLIKNLVKILNIPVKTLRKKHPYLAAYCENRCCPTRQGVAKVIFLAKMLTYKEKEALLEHLQTFITANKNQKFDEFIQHRTRYITVVLEDIFQPHNASAVLRTCDCFGIQDIHIIENQNKYTLNPDVALGSSKWINLYKYNKF